jgi:hypothetical protein
MVYHERSLSSSDPRYIPEGTKIPQEAEETEEQEKPTIPVGTGSAA